MFDIISMQSFSTNIAMDVRYYPNTLVIKKQQRTSGIGLSSQYNSELFLAWGGDGIGKKSLFVFFVRKSIFKVIIQPKSWYKIKKKKQSEAQFLPLLHTLHACLWTQHHHKMRCRHKRGIFRMIHFLRSGLLPWWPRPEELIDTETAASKQCWLPGAINIHTIQMFRIGPSKHTKVIQHVWKEKNTEWRCLANIIEMQSEKKNFALICDVYKVSWMLS